MNREINLTYTEKLAVAAGSLSALALLPGAAGAVVIDVTGSPVSLAMAAADGTTVTWDVDGGGLNTGHEFELFRYGSGASGSIHLASGSSGGAVFNGRGLVGPTFYTDNVQALSASFQVGPNLANSLVWGSYTSGGYRYRNIMGTYSTYPGGPTFFIGYDFDYGFNVGENFFGFRFADAAGDLHYGFAVVDFDTANGVVTIDRWAYETVADTAIHVQAINDVPEPETSSLALLGLGAGGLAAWRRRRQHQQQKARADA